MSWARATLSLGARGVLAYRAGVAIRLVSAALVAGLTAAVWVAVTDGRDAVAGVPSHDLVAYAVVAFLSSTAWTTPVAGELAGRARSGDVSLLLLRPVPLQRWLYLRDVGRAAVTFALTALPLLLVITPLLGGLAPPDRWALFVGSLVLAHGVAFGLAWGVGLAALLLHEGRGLLALQGAAFALLSGALIPLDLYPPAVTEVARLLPFAALADGPARLLLGRAGPEVLALQAAWAAALALGGAVAWRGLQRRLVVQGG